MQLGELLFFFVHFFSLILFYHAHESFSFFLLSSSTLLFNICLFYSVYFLLPCQLLMFVFHLEAVKATSLSYFSLAALNLNETFGVR